MNKRIIKRVALILACLLLVCASVGIAVLAEDTAPTVEIAKKNIAYEGAIQVVYLIDSANLEDGQSIKVVFNGGEYEKKPAGKITVDGKEYDAVYSDGIVAKEYRKSLKATPVIIDAEGKTVASGSEVDFTPYDYAMARFDSEKISKPQFDLYKALLDYGAAVQTILNYTDDNIDELGGWIDEYYNTVITDELTGEVLSYKRGKTSPDSTYTADRLAEGKIFLGFYEGDNKVSSVTWNKYTVKPGTTEKIIRAKFVDGTNPYNQMNGLSSLPSGMRDASFNLNASESSKRYSTYKTESGNTYLFLRQNGSTSGAHQVYFDMNTAYARSVAYEFDIRFEEMANLQSDGTAIFMKFNGLLSTGSQGYSSVAHAIAYKDGSPLIADSNYTINMNEWMNIRFEFVKKENGVGYDLTTYINGNKLVFWTSGVGYTSYSKSVAVYDLPFLYFESRYSNETNSSDVSYSVDNLRIDVGESCTEHSLTDLNDSGYLKATASCKSGTSYYKSCSVCGFKSDETFELDDKKNDHIFGEYPYMTAMKTAPTKTAPAVYYKSCGVCGLALDETFTYGTVSNYTVGKAPSFGGLSFAAAASAPTTDANGNGIGDGVYTIVKSETMTNSKGEDIQNLYLRFTDENYSGQKKITFSKSAESGKSKYVFEFDFRWQYATNFRHGKTELDYGVIYNNDIGGVTGALGYFDSASDGSYLLMNGKELHSGEWHRIKYEYIWNSENSNYDITVYIDGNIVKTTTGKAISFIWYPRWGDGKSLDQAVYGTGNVDMQFDLGNLYYYSE